MDHFRNPGGGLTNTRQTVYEDFPPSSDWTHDANCHVLLIDLPGFKRGELKVRVDNLRKLTVSGERQVTENKYTRFKQVYEVPEDSDIDNISGRFDSGLLFIIIPKKKTEGMHESKNETQSVNEVEEEKKDKKPDMDFDDKQKHEKKNEKHEEPKNDGFGEHNHVENAEKLEKPKGGGLGKQNYQRKNEKQNEEPKNDDFGDLQNQKKEEKKRNIGEEGLAGVIGKKMKMDWRELKGTMATREELDDMMKTAVDKIKNNKTIIITALLAFSVGLYASRKISVGLYVSRKFSVGP